MSSQAKSANSGKQGNEATSGVVPATARPRRSVGNHGNMGKGQDDDLLRELSKEQMIEYYEAFCRYDHDNSGTIDNSELGEIMNSMGLHVREDELDQLLKQVDEDRSGSLDFMEFLNLMVRHINKPVTPDEIRSAFLVFDTQNRGYVTVDELRKILTTRGDRMTLEEANEMIAAADMNGDGMINYEEFSTAFFG